MILFLKLIVKINICGIKACKILLNFSFHSKNTFFAEELETRAEPGENIIQIMLNE